MTDEDQVRIDELFAAYADRMIGGETIDLQAVADAYPDIGTELVHELRAFQQLASDETELPDQSFGEYSIIRQLGRGGMGIVYEAWQDSLKRQVALKVLPTGFASDAKTVARFVREAQVSAKLRHDNIVPVYGMGIEGQTPFYSMECVYGRTLSRVIADLREGTSANAKSTSNANSEPQENSADQIGSGPELNLEYCLKLSAAFAGVAEGLQHAHGMGVVHRDIKPSNLIFDGDGEEDPDLSSRLRVLDFGLARFDGQESLTVSGDVLGTVKYMSPEQTRSREADSVDCRTDIYSLGATIYEALTLKPPFEGKDHQDTLRLIIHKDPTSPSRINPRIPRDLVRLFDLH